MSVTINWKGKIGYGDIVSPICYAHNEAERRGEEVTLNFYFEHAPGTKFKEEDSETINDRIDYIVKNTPGSAIVNQFYNHKLGYDHTNYDDSNRSYHNLRFAKETWTGEDGHIAIVPSYGNKKQFDEYAPGKRWKDPLSGQWEEYINDLGNRHRVSVIDYATPVSQAADIIKKSKIVIGYHGSLMWLARWLQAPMIVISDKKSFTEKGFPWSVHSYSSVHYVINNLQEYSLYRLNEVKRTLDEYLHRV